jgi:hypothetical protein
MIIKKIILLTYISYFSYFGCEVKPRFIFMKKAEMKFPPVPSIFKRTKEHNVQKENYFLKI